jgi:2-hydroxychromene-2-carboxylate isomerase
MYVPFLTSVSFSSALQRIIFILTLPPVPINTLPIQRVLAALSISHPSSLPSAIFLFYQNFWVHYAEPTKPENLLAIVSTVVGGEEEATKVLEASKGEEAKKRLSGNTDKAFGEGAFGLPWFVGKCIPRPVKDVVWCGIES